MFLDNQCCRKMCFDVKTLQTISPFKRRHKKEELSLSLQCTSNNNTKESLL